MIMKYMCFRRLNEKEKKTYEIDTECKFIRESTNTCREL